LEHLSKVLAAEFPSLRKTFHYFHQFKHQILPRVLLKKYIMCRVSQKHKIRCFTRNMQ